MCKKSARQRRQGQAAGKNRRKTQEVAQQRKALAEQEASFVAERERARNLLAVLEARLAEPDDTEDLEALRHENPAEYAARVAEMMQRSSLAQAAAAERARLETQEREAQAKQRQAETAEEMGKLLEALPAWKDPTVAQREYAQILTTIKSVGYTEQDLIERLWRLAQRWRKDPAEVRKTFDAQGLWPSVASAIRVIGVITPTGGTAKTWTFQASSLTADPFDYYTDEWGDDVTTDWINAGGGTIDKLEIGFDDDLGAFDISADLIYANAITNTGPTGGITTNTSVDLKAAASGKVIYPYENAKK